MAAIVRTESEIIIKISHNSENDYILDNLNSKNINRREMTNRQE